MILKDTFKLLLDLQDSQAEKTNCDLLDMELDAYSQDRTLIATHVHTNNGILFATGIYSAK